jgi:hypothetical protein
MIIQTDITQKDFRAFVRHVAIGPDGGRSMYLALWGTVLGVGVTVGITLALTGVQLHLPSLMAGLFGGVFWLLIFSRIHARNTGPAADGCIYGPRTVSITAEGLRECSPKCESLFHWSSIRSVVSLGDHVFVMVDRNAGIIVPRRAFASDTERDQFLAEIRSHLPPTAPGVSGSRHLCPP